MLQGIMLGDLARTAMSALSTVKIASLLKTMRPGAGLLLGPSLAMVGAGIAIGTGIGIMIAPCSGRETRNGLRRAVQNGVAKMKKRGDGESLPLDPHATRSNGEAMAQN
jgi:hypothetical protein